MDNYKMILKGIKGEKNKCRVILCSWIGRLNVKMPGLPKLIDGFD